VKRPREEVTHIGRGDILLVNFAPAHPGEADHTRPAIVITNDVANEHSPALVVIPVTSNVERVYPFELLLPASRTGLDLDSKAQVQFIRHISKARIRRSLGHLPSDLLERLDEQVRGHLGL